MVDREGDKSHPKAKEMVSKNCSKYKEMVKHERHLFGIEHCFMQGTSDALIVFFMGASPFYGGLTMVSEGDEYSYLFLKDDPYYTTFTERPYLQVVNHYKKNPNRTMFYGISMGAIAAINLGIDAGIAGIMAIDPECIDFDINRTLHKLEAIPADNTIEWPILFIEYTKGASGILTKIKTVLHYKPVTMISMPWISNTHADFIPSIEMVSTTIQYMFQMRNINKKHVKT